MIIVPLGIWSVLPSMITVTVSGGVVVVIGLVSSVAFAADHVDHAEGRNDVGDEEPRQHLGQDGGGRKTGGAHAALPGPPGSVGDDVEAELAVAGLGEGVHLSRRHVDAVHDDLE